MKNLIALGSVFVTFFTIQNSSATEYITETYEDSNLHNLSKRKTINDNGQEKIAKKSKLDKETQAKKALKQVEKRLRLDKKEPVERNK